MKGREGSNGRDGGCPAAAPPRPPGWGRRLPAVRHRAPGAEAAVGTPRLAAGM